MTHKMESNPYIPTPADTSGITLPPALQQLAETLAANTHEVWGQGRYEQGWRYGATRNDGELLTPCLVPYEQLSETEKDYDRHTSQETLKLILKLGYQIIPPEK
jgi:ryanodine receptor 2